MDGRGESQFTYVKLPAAEVRPLAEIAPSYCNSDVARVRWAIAEVVRVAKMKSMKSGGNGHHCED